MPARQATSHMIHLRFLEHLEPLIRALAQLQFGHPVRLERPEGSMKCVPSTFQLLQGDCPEWPAVPADTFAPQNYMR